MRGVRRPNFLAGGSLDRAAHLRRNDGWLEEQLGNTNTRITLVWRSRNLVRTGDRGVAAALIAAPECDQLIESPESLILLGVAEDITHLALDVSHLESPDELEVVRGAGEFQDLRQIGARLGDGDGHLLAYARAMTLWHSRHRFCSACGSPTKSIQAGHLRRCENRECGSQHFPRTDPAVIMLVNTGERCLLGRQPSWPPGMYSTLAGFVEAGESLENAVAREVQEETGIEVTSVHYHSSQPWPFPCSLMLGFFATAAAASLPQVGGDELEEAKWFERRELARRETRQIRLPPRLSIARRLIDDWLAGEPSTGGG